MADHDHDGDSDSLSSSSSESYEEVEASVEDVALQAQLETSLEGNPRQYDVQLQYIALLKRCKMGQRLNTARRSMQQLFPLTEDLWLDWLSQEQLSSTEPEDVSRLYKLAVEDYLSVPLWEAYLRFLIGLTTAPSPARLDGFQAEAEQAVCLAGLHLAQGQRIWQTYRSFAGKAWPSYSRLVPQRQI